MGILNWLFGLKDAPKAFSRTPAGKPEPGVAEPITNHDQQEPHTATTNPFNDAPSEIVRIGAFGGRIVSVTKKRIKYLDMAGQEQFVDLEACARNWMGWRNDHKEDFIPLSGATEQSIAEWNAKCVGIRDATKTPPWVKFKNQRKTRFEFETRDDLYAELLIPLEKAGWHTFDTA